MRISSQKPLQPRKEDALVLRDLQLLTMKKCPHPIKVLPSPRCFHIPFLIFIKNLLRAAVRSFCRSPVDPDDLMQGDRTQKENFSHVPFDLSEALACEANSSCPARHRRQAWHIEMSFVNKHFYRF